MGSLQEELAKKGLISERVARERKAQEEIEAEDRELALKTTRVVGIPDLQACTTRAEFMRQARLVLEQDPSLIAAVVRLGHRLPNDGSSAHRKFVAQLLDARRQMQKVPEKDRPRFLRRFFRK